MSASQKLDEFLENYPVYNLINFSTDDNQPERLHPIYILTQYIIDKLISDGCKRIAIILPDNDCNVLPMILAKYFSNIQYESNYASSVLDDIERGQHIRLGKAVVEFLGIDKEKNRIIFRMERKNPIEVTYPINGIHYLFEKTEGAISSFKTWNEAKKEAELQFEEVESFVTTLKVKRTVLRKTIALLTAKNDFMGFTENLKINGQKFENVVTYGEIDLDNPNKFRLYNKGRLDCLPSIGVTAKIEELYYLLKDAQTRDQVFAIFSTIKKFDEVVQNPDTVKKILRQQVPFVVFVPENGFENFPILTDFDFEVWHWKPSTMNSDALLVPVTTERKKNGKSLFGNIAEKINRAALSDFKIYVSNNKGLRDSVRLIRMMSRQTYNSDNVLRQLVRKMWAFQKKLTLLVCKIMGRVKDELSNELEQIKDLWISQKYYYTGQDLEFIVDKIIELFTAFISEEKPTKLEMLEKCIKEISCGDKSVVVLIPDKYGYYTEALDFLKEINGDGNLHLSRLSDFYMRQEKDFEGFDLLVSPWFDKDEYIRIKQTYCYDKLAFVMYDYENRWRESYVKKIDDCVPHGLVKKTGDKMKFAQPEIYDNPFDRVFSSDNEELDEISDYNIPKTIIRATFENKDIEKDNINAIECVPVLLSEDKISYFFPAHEVFDVTALVKGETDVPTRKEAAELKTGDKILIRQSDKDIIREKADELMLQQGEQALRKKTERWHDLLRLYAENKLISDVCTNLNEEGGECTLQQVRYWLAGETIVPREKGILIAIGIVASRNPELKVLCDDYLNMIDEIVEAGKKVQQYHIKAGRWLSRELRNKAYEIRAISNSSTAHGIIDGIGEVHVYTVEEVLNKEIVGSEHINRIEDLY